MGSLLLFTIRAHFDVEKWKWLLNCEATDIKVISGLVVCIYISQLFASASILRPLRVVVRYTIYHSHKRKLLSTAIQNVIRECTHKIVAMTAKLAGLLSTRKNEEKKIVSPTSCLRNLILTTCKINTKKKLARVAFFLDICSDLIAPEQRQ